MPDLSIPANLPVFLQNQLKELVNDYTDEHLTDKGYETKRKLLLDQYANGHRGPMTPVRASTQSMTPFHRRNQSCGSNLRTTHASPIQGDNNSISSSIYQNDSSTVDSSLRNSSQIKHRRHQSLYRVTTGNSVSGYSTSASKDKAPSVQLSLPSNEVSGVSYNPMIPLLPREQSPFSFDSWSSILRGRFEHYSAETAIVNVNLKGKETSISWDKLYLRAEKVAHVLHKDRLHNMDKVLLWYNRTEIIEFTVALLGCFVAGMVAVPISFETYSLNEIVEIIKLTNSKHLLISNDCYSQVDNLHSTSNHAKVKVIKSDFFSKINFIKTDDLGIYSKAKSSAPKFDVPEVSYIEFTRTPLGRLSGVLMKHKILSNQFKTLANIINSRSMPHWKKNNVIRPIHKKESYTRYTILNSLDPTRSTGLVLGTVFNVFSGNLLVSIDHRLLQKAGSYENMIDRYKADILLNDQLQLKQVVINYLDDPQSTISKKHRIELSCIKCCLTSCTTIDTEVTDMIVNKWLKNLGCLDATISYSPILTLLDFGGVFLSVRDQVGNLDNFQVHDPKLRLHDELFVNKEKLRGNVVEPSVTAMMNSSNSFKDYLRLATFGYPIPDATVCVVNPDDNTLVPDLTVGEIWAHSESLTDEFFQMDRITDFVFRAKLNYPKMFSFLSPEGASSVERERLNTIMNVCPSSITFLRTKLMGFVHNGKVYVLSLVEDMFLQNQLVRLPNWAHTSDLNKVNQLNEDSNSAAQRSYNGSYPKIRRVVQTYYLQQVTETVVRTVNTVLEVSAFELNHNKDEHFLAVVVESFLARTVATEEPLPATIAERQKEVLQKKMNDVTEQIYRILWIFHRIQPFCVIMVSPDSLPRRYCSLEIANSTVEKKFFSGELDAKFVKFQVDNVVLDFLPHSQYYNESIFSGHLSSLRRSALAEAFREANTPSVDSGLQISGIDYRDTSVDLKSGVVLTDYDNILQVLESRFKNGPNYLSFSDGSESTGSSNENNTHKKLTWCLFETIVASFIKKIVGSKSPLKAGDRVIIMCDNSVEYVAMVLACMYCNFIIIPYPVLNENDAESSTRKFANVVRAYGVSRIFTDARTFNLLDNGITISKALKKYKHLFPKISNFSKVKKKSGITINTFKNLLKEKYARKPGTDPAAVPCVVWIDDQNDAKSNIFVNMTHSALMKSCKILKETLQLSASHPLFSLSGHTHSMGFIMSCILGIYVGCPTKLFSLPEVSSDPRAFMLALQNSKVKDLYLQVDAFRMLIEKANSLVTSKFKPKVNKKSSASTIRPDVFKNVSNIMIPFTGRPEFSEIEILLRRNSAIVLNLTQLNYVYHHHFNSFISLRSYLCIPPVNLYLNPVALREGTVEIVESSVAASGNLLRVQDSGIVPVCTDVSIVNPETNLPCFEGEFGEIWCCSEANAYGYSICNDVLDMNSSKPLRSLIKDPFITDQFKSKLKGEADKGLTYLRTGDLGFMKKMPCVDAQGNTVELRLLFVLGSINETVEILGLTHFVRDLEKTVSLAHRDIDDCIIAKAGGLLVCLIKCNKNSQVKYPNLTALIASELLKNHGVILDLCAFVKKGTITPNDWPRNRVTVMRQWFDQTLTVDEQFGINFGENISMYLLSEFEKAS